jgi:hypothetical protein
MRIHETIIEVLGESGAEIVVRGFWELGIGEELMKEYFSLFARPAKERNQALIDFFSELVK